LSSRSILLFNFFQQGFEDEGAAAEEDGVVLEEDIEGFAGDLAVKKEVFVVCDEEDGGGGGLEIFQVAPFDAQSALAPVILEFEGVVVDLYQSQCLDVCMSDVEVCLIPDL
jgi:hypothetical protein